MSFSIPGQSKDVPQGQSLLSSREDAPAAARVSLSPTGSVFLGLAPPPFVVPPAHLPDPEPRLAFNVAEMKREIFQQARETIRSSAEYTKQGRKPWTQITVRIPLTSSETTDDDDLAVVYHMMNQSTRKKVKENNKGDWTWTIWGTDGFLTWLGIDSEATLPVDKYVHPVRYDTGEEERRRLEKKLQKAGGSSDYDYLNNQLAKLDAKQKEQKKEYAWAAYDQCSVIFKKKQGRKENFRELQLTIKIRTFYCGHGDPAQHNGYMHMSHQSNLRDMDPTTQIYAVLQKSGIFR